MNNRDLCRKANKHFWFIFLLVYLGFTDSWAQTDSLYTDTVVIVKPPVVITQQVHVSDPSHPRASSAFDAGIYYSLNKNVAPSSSSVTGMFQTTGFQVRYHQGNLEIGSGLGILTSSMTYTLHQSVGQGSSLSIHTDTLDCYQQISMTGDTTIVCHTQNDTSWVPKGAKEFSVEKKTTLHYLQIPLSIGYTFRKEKWYLTPSVQVIFNKRIGSTNEDLGQKDLIWMAGGQVSVGRSFYEHFLVEIKGQYQQNISSVYTQSPYENNNWNLLGIGLSLYYRF
jgi:hypothetical protein